MAYRHFIPIQKRRFYRKEMMYQVIMEDICDIFGYEKDSPEFKKVRELIDGFSKPTKKEAVPQFEDNPVAEEEED